MSETTPAQPPTAPPPGFDPDALTPEDTSRWPKVIGVFSLIYAVGGLLCSVGVGAMSALAGTFRPPGAPAVDVSLTIKAMWIVPAILNFVLGVLMLMGAVKLLQRRRKGVSLLQRWAVMRMATLLLSVVIGVVTISAQIDIARANSQAGGRDASEVPSDELLHRGVIIQTAVISSLVAVYPLFLGFYLSRRNIQDQIKHWPTR